eukprot:Hpha_TRINITY_DN10465_c0_g1::TRINITY_DN10465_c0_g1_i1::g.193277::m.193277/K05844/rimK; ribosomal protein S6--L-glutamate ligase
MTTPTAKRRRVDLEQSARVATRRASCSPSESSPPPTTSRAARTPAPIDPATVPLTWKWSTPGAKPPRSGRWVLLLGKPTNQRCARLIAAFRSQGLCPALAVSPPVLASGRIDFKFHVDEDGNPTASPPPMCVVPCCKGRLLYRTIVLMERWGIPSLNPSCSLLKTYDKWMQYRSLGDLMPPTARVAAPVNGLAIARSVATDPEAPFPVVLKATQGSGGDQVFLCEKWGDMLHRAAALFQQGKRVIAQQYIEESKGTDTRLYVVDGEVVAAMRRVATKEQEFKANLACGGSGFAHEPTPEEIRVALDAVGRLGLRVAGVDVLASKKGPMLCEVNANPGVRIQGITGTDIAGRVAKLAIRLAQEETRQVDGLPASLADLISADERTALLAVPPGRANVRISTPATSARAMS